MDFGNSKKSIPLLKKFNELYENDEALYDLSRCLV